LGMDVSLETWAVAAARIHDHVAAAIHSDRPAIPASVRQIEYAATLGLDVQQDSVRVASAKIGDTLNEQNRKALIALGLKPGDAVQKTEKIEHEGTVHSFTNDYIVSSIGTNGRVYFKGTGCRSAWPSQIEKLLDDSSAI